MMFAHNKEEDDVASIIIGGRTIYRNTSFSKLKSKSGSKRRRRRRRRSTCNSNSNVISISIVSIISIIIIIIIINSSMLLRIISGCSGLAVLRHRLTSSSSRCGIGSADIVVVGCHAFARPRITAASLSSSSSPSLSSNLAAVVDDVNDVNDDDDDDDVKIWKKEEKLVKKDEEYFWWHGAMEPWGIYAVHVLVGKNDVVHHDDDRDSSSVLGVGGGVIDVESAILRSLKTFGHYNTSSNSTNEKNGTTTAATLVVTRTEQQQQQSAADTDADADTAIIGGYKKVDVGGKNEDIALEQQQQQQHIIMEQIKNVARGNPMTPQQLLQLGAVWYLSSEDYQQNLEDDNNNADECTTTTNDDQDQVNTPLTKATKQNQNQKYRRSVLRKVKPKRLSLRNSTHNADPGSAPSSVLLLREGDYLRIHYNPRRYPEVYTIPWSSSSWRDTSIGTATDNNNNNNNNNNNKGHEHEHEHEYEHNGGIIHQQGPGYMIVNKPSFIPVHANVDNAIENVVYQLWMRQQQQYHQRFKNSSSDSTERGEDERGDRETTSLAVDEEFKFSESGKDNDNQEPYIAPCQRIDVNTSGLLVLATQPEFASYFSLLLQNKTKYRHRCDRNHDNYSDDTTDNTTSIVSKIMNRKDTKNNASIQTPTTTNNNTLNNDNSSSRNIVRIQKGYRCLVCIKSNNNNNDDSTNNGNDDDDDTFPASVVYGGTRRTESVLQAWNRLSKLQQQQQLPGEGRQSSSSSSSSIIIKHYLKSSYYSPKEFVESIPISKNNDSHNWLECLMEITKVSKPYPIYCDSSSSTSATKLRNHDDDNNDDDDDDNDFDDEGTTTNNLADELWLNDDMRPNNVKAVAEVHVNLITGRTHQIRGQLSCLGFPIVGDEQYGGAKPLPLSVPPDDSVSSSTSLSEKKKNREGRGDDGRSRRRRRNYLTSVQQYLALQCCSVRFPEAEYESIWNRKKQRDVSRGRPNRHGRCVEAALECAWWTPLLKRFDQHNDDITTNADAATDSVVSDIDYDDEDDDDDGNSNALVQSSVDKHNDIDIQDDINNKIRSDLLPPTVQLSPGRNKYVVAKIRDPSSSKLRWFVISSTGTYHADVAKELFEWIHSVPGYEHVDISVTGGGRVFYEPKSSSILVYGFSYRYGKGDHAKVVQLIKEYYSSCSATIHYRNDDLFTVKYDLSDELY